jgi:hypothetical protein
MKTLFKPSVAAIPPHANKESPQLFRAGLLARQRYDRADPLHRDTRRK